MSTLKDLIGKKFVNQFLLGSNSLGKNPQIVIKNVTLTTSDNVQSLLTEIKCAIDVLQKAKMGTHVQKAQEKLDLKLESAKITKNDRRVKFYCISEKAKLTGADFVFNTKTLQAFLDKIRKDFENTKDPNDDSTATMYDMLKEAFIALGASVRQRRGSGSVAPTPGGSTSQNTHEVPFKLDFEDEEESEEADSEEADPQNFDAAFENMDRKVKLEESSETPVRTGAKPTVSRNIMGTNTAATVSTQAGPRDQQQQIPIQAAITFLPSIASLQNAEKYSGKPGEDLKGFVKTMKIYLSGMGGSEAEKLLFLGSKLEGPARSVYNRFIRGSENATLNEVLQELLDSFGSQMNKHHAKEIMLQRQKLPDETMTMYLMAKWDLITDAGIENPAKVNYYLLEGLNNPELITRYANSMEENTKDLIRKLETEERVTKKMSRSKRLLSSQSDIRSQTATNFEGNEIVVKKLETPTIEEKAREQAEDVGHPDLVHVQRMIDELRFGFEKLEKKYQPDRPNKKISSRRDPCRFCGKTNHEAIDCWNRPDGGNQGHGGHRANHSQSQRYSEHSSHGNINNNRGNFNGSYKQSSSNHQQSANSSRHSDTPNRNNGGGIACWNCGGPHPKRLCGDQNNPKNMHWEGGHQ